MKCYVSGLACARNRTIFLPFLTSLMRKHTFDCRICFFFFCLQSFLHRTNNYKIHFSNNNQQSFFKSFRLFQDSKLFGMNLKVKMTKKIIKKIPSTHLTKLLFLQLNQWNSKVSEHAKVTTLEVLARNTVFWDSPKVHQVSKLTAFAEKKFFLSEPEVYEMCEPTVEEAAVRY